MGSRLMQWAQRLKRQLLAVHYASRHPGTPLVVKVLAGLVLLYALSPVDLIPDCVPVLGYLDDALLLPLGILLVVRLVPAEVWEQCRAEAETHTGERLSPRSGGLVLVGAAWVLLLAAAWVLARRQLAR